MGIHFKTDVFAAVAVVDAKTPCCSCKLDAKERYSGQQFGQIERELSLKLLKPLLSIKTPPGNENQIFQYKKLR